MGSTLLSSETIFCLNLVIFAVVHHHRPRYRVFGGGITVSCVFRGTARGYERMFAPDVQRSERWKWLIARSFGCQRVDSRRKPVRPSFNVVTLHIFMQLENLYVRTKMPRSFRQRVRLRYRETHQGYLFTHVFYGCRSRTMDTALTDYGKKGGAQKQARKTADATTTTHAQPAKWIDFAAADMSRGGPNECEERDWDSDSDNTTAEKGVVGGCRGNISGMPEQGGEHNQVGAVNGEGKRFGQYGRTEDAASVKGKAEVWLHLLDY
ncbi:hypothetical protein EDD15DRAFT_2199076 [Pisolithus albus]|nr:hypothetical protein EDD15DRAFT_2199076 [Pisolithus albus]